MDLAHIGRELVDTFGIVDFRPDGQREVKSCRVLIGVAERQERQKGFSVEVEHPGIGKEMIGAGAIAQDRTMAQHHALGGAPCS